MNPSARIDRVNTSWRVRVPGHRPQFFADGAHGGKDASFAAAVSWRDERWDGKYLFPRLTEEQRDEIGRSTGSYREMMEKYGISQTYVHQLRRQHRSKATGEENAPEP